MNVDEAVLKIHRLYVGGEPSPGLAEAVREVLVDLQIRATVQALRDAEVLKAQWEKKDGGV